MGVYLGGGSISLLIVFYLLLVLSGCSDYPIGKHDRSLDNSDEQSHCPLHYYLNFYGGEIRTHDLIKPVSTVSTTSVIFTEAGPSRTI